MRIDWVPSRRAAKAQRAYIAHGGRDVEFVIGPGIKHEAVLLAPGRRTAGDIRVEVLGSRLSAERMPAHSGDAFRPTVKSSPTTFNGEIDWEQGVVRGTFESRMESDWRQTLPIVSVFLAAIVGVLLGLAFEHWYVGVVVFVVLAAFFYGLGRLAGGSGRNYAVIVQNDLWRMAMVIAGKGLPTGRDRSAQV